MPGSRNTWGPDRPLAKLPSRHRRSFRFHNNNNIHIMIELKYSENTGRRWKFPIVNEKQLFWGDLEVSMTKLLVVSQWNLGVDEMRVTKQYVDLCWPCLNSICCNIYFKIDAIDKIEFFDLFTHYYDILYNNWTKFLNKYKKMNCIRMYILYFIIFLSLALEWRATFQNCNIFSVLSIFKWKSKW